MTQNTLNIMLLANTGTQNYIRYQQFFKTTYFVLKNCSASDKIRTWASWYTSKIPLLFK